MNFYESLNRHVEGLLATWNFFYEFINIKNGWDANKEVKVLDKLQ